MQSAQSTAQQAIMAPLMAALRERVLLEWIQAEYLSLPEGLKPPDGIWIRRYPPVPPDTQDVNDTTMFPHAVWFVDQHGLRRENVWKWRRLVTVQWEKPWCQRTWAEPNAVFGQRFLIGLAAFAPYVDGSGFYMETQWAGLFGHGWRVSISDTGVMSRSGLWIS